jgi:hypothetical protein
MQYTSRDTYQLISQQSNDPIVEWKTCAIAGVEFPIYQSDLSFYDKMSPTFDSKKLSLPTPTLCPEERARRRLGWRNERKLYRRKCDASQKDIISIYKPGTAYTVYSSDFRWGDDRNPLDYGLDYDSSKTFTQHMDQLMKSVPQLALIGANNENSPYINLTADSKNCYMLIESSNCEDCYHSYRLQESRDCVDSSFGHKCAQSYELDNSENCSKLYRSRDCKDCGDGRLLQNCINCQHCFGCVNLLNTNYAIFNKTVTPEEYKQFMATFVAKQDELLPAYRQQFADLIKSLPVQAMKLTNTEWSYGHYLRHAQNCVFCVDGYDAQDCRYAEHIWRNAKDVMDVSTIGRDAERIYETINSGMSISNYIGCAVCRSCTDMYYSFTCFNSHHCFGCVWLRNQSYCIFNKQYTKESYELLVASIIQSMQTAWERGAFFPLALSPFSYNETAAQDTYPLTQSEAEKLWSSWLAAEAPINLPDNASTVQGSDLPKLIQEVSDDITHQIIVCEVSGKPFRIIRQELDFYRKHHLPLPTTHPDVRHAQRLAQRAGRTLYVRTCDKTGEKIVSVYPPDAPLTVYSETAYQFTIYS